MTDRRLESGGTGRLDWGQVGILYAREMRAALREKTIVVYSILMPIFLYPLILWAMFTGLMFVQGQTERYVARVAALDWPPGHPVLRRHLDRDEQFRWLEKSGAAEDLEKQIRDGDLDALLVFMPANATNSTLPGNFQVRLTFNESKERSVTARQRLLAALDRYRDQWLKREALTHQVTPAEWQRFTVTTRNLASRKQLGLFLLGRLLPIFLVIMVAMGCFYPAVDATAGERERHTWETLMSTAATRLSIVTAKYLYVATMGGLAGMLNLAAMLVTLKPVFAPLLSRVGDDLVFTVPLTALPILFLATLLLCGFVAAGMMLFAAFARTFKEGQAMATPFYMIILLPVMFLQAPGIKFTLALAALPIVNVTLMVQAAIAGNFPWAPIAVTLLVSLALIAGCLRLAAYILQFEDVILGSYSGSFHNFIQERVLRRTKPVTPLPKALS